MHKYWLILLFVVVLNSCSETNYKEPVSSGINWKVENRFRLFEDADDKRQHAIERLLNHISENARLQDSHELVVDTLSGAQAQSLRQSHYNSETQKYSEKLIAPKSYRISAWLEEPEPGKCKWKGKFLANAIVQDCNQSVTLDIPSAFNSSSEFEVDAKIEVELLKSRQLLESRIALEDVLIVAIGDSYTSGEGNPDVPAKFDGIWKPEFLENSGIPPEEFSKPRWPSSEKLEAAFHKLSDLSIADWWDVPCHRSLLSWPVLAGLRMAAENEQRAVTLVHLGCAGSEFSAGIQKPQGKLPGGGWATTSQLEDLKMLQKRAGVHRPVDFFVFTFGGNDAGFNDLLPDLLAARLAPDRTGERENIITQHTILSNVRRPAVERAEIRLSRLPDKSRKLDGILRPFLEKDGKIIHLKYPSPLEFQFQDQSFHFCRTPLSDRDFEVLQQKIESAEDQQDRKNLALDLERELRFLYLYHPGLKTPPDFRDNGNDSLSGVLPENIVKLAKLSFELEIVPNDDARQTCKYSPEKGIKEIGNASVCDIHWVISHLNAMIALNSDLGWIVVDEHLRDTQAMGWCGKRKYERLSMPVLEADKKWSHDSYKNFDPYAADLPRWFRTANDSAFTQYRSPKTYYHSALHPSVHAQLVMAQAAFEAMAGPN